MPQTGQVIGSKWSYALKWCKPNNDDDDDDGDDVLVVVAIVVVVLLTGDRLVVLDAGHICEFDSPAKLLDDTNSRFYAMAKDAGIVTSRE